ncbi:hypothetical protein BCR44DRAFT_41259 [Catenaria anguillulae PL171]|uniref:Uncharacterized protein n=1 Tax=Catenaria anguillulae PL171 TaxID=765915 RepID=A0A1Y2HXE4_9FUNG|nr:hypothetical protein BCR44DRAFT_41259 [Catenaria anguillulae PL171]
MESVATLIFESLVGASVTFIALRVLATTVLFRYIAVMAKERERIKQKEALEIELSSSPV